MFLDFYVFGVYGFISLSWQPLQITKEKISDKEPLVEILLLLVPGKQGGTND